MLRLHPRWSVQIHTFTNVSRGIHRHQIQLLVWFLNQNRQNAAAYACFVSQWFSCFFSIRIVCCQLLLSAETYPNPRSPDTVDIRLWEIGVCMPRRIFVTECCEVVVFCALFIIIYITIILLCVEVFFLTALCKQCAFMKGVQSGVVVTGWAIWFQIPHK